MSLQLVFLSVRFYLPIKEFIFSHFVLKKSEYSKSYKKNNSGCDIDNYAFNRVFKEKSKRLKGFDVQYSSIKVITL